ncbi:MAG: RHS repeat-associated core domain-containing protein, partial [Telluria sp.]
TAMALRKNDNKAGQPPVRERHFSYDPAGNLTRIEHRWDDSQQALGKHSYTYDPLGQLLSAVQPGLTEIFAFDPAGNLLDIAQPAPDTSLSNGQLPAPTKVDAAGLAPITHNLLKAYQGFSYEYDEQGNAIRKNLVLPRAGEKDELELAYDTENRLIRAVRTRHRARHSTHYRYDAFSRRVAKHVTQEKWANSQDPAKDAPTTTSHAALFVWDGDVMVQELRQDKTVTYLYEPDGFVPLARIESNGGFGGAANASQAGATRAASTDDHIHLPHVSQWDLPAARQEPTREDAEAEDRHRSAWQKRQSDADNAALQDRIDQYNCDHLGTPRELIDQQGRVVWSVRYKAWGRVIHEDVHEVEQPLRFQGQYGDAETGLHYNRYRYYDPESARYVTQDPIGLFGGLNLYAYAQNPTGWIDPLGLAKKCPAHPVCNPCDGKDPAAAARTWQGKGEYPGVDSYTNMVLKKGTILYTLYPYSSQASQNISAMFPNYYVTNHSVLAAAGSIESYHERTQVAPGKDPISGTPRPYRQKLRVFRVKQDICVAKGKALENSTHGSGGATQYFVPDAEKANLSGGSLRDI